MGNYVKQPEWKSKTVLALVRAIAAYVFFFMSDNDFIRNMKPPKNDALFKI